MMASLLRILGRREAGGMTEEGEDWIPGYRVVRELGRGGTATVYLVERRVDDTSQLLACKVFRIGWFADREVRNLVDLAHPNLAAIRGDGLTEDGERYVLSDYVADGRPIDEYCERNRLGLAARLQLFGQVCEGVGFAHGVGCYHYDLKPANILVDGTGRVRVVDFGHSVRDSMGQGQAGFTREYAAPEQLAGQPAKAATDIFALGRILSMLLVSAEISTPADLYKVAQEGAQHPEPERRYGSVAALWADVEAAAADRAVSIERGDWGTRVRRWLRRHRRVLAASTLVIGLLGMFAYQSFRAERRSRSELLLRRAAEMEADWGNLAERRRLVREAVELDGSAEAMGYAAALEGEPLLTAAYVIAAPDGDSRILKMGVGGGERPWVLAVTARYLLLHRLRDSEALRIEGTGGDVLAAEMDEERLRLAVVLRDRVKIWSMAEGKPQLVGESSWNGELSASGKIAFSKDGRCALFQSADGRLGAWSSAEPNVPLQWVELAAGETVKHSRGSETGFVLEGERGSRNVRCPAIRVSEMVRRPTGASLLGAGTGWRALQRDLAVDWERDGRLADRVRLFSREVEWDAAAGRVTPLVVLTDGRVAYRWPGASGKAMALPFGMARLSLPRVTPDGKRAMLRVDQKLCSVGLIGEGEEPTCTEAGGDVVDLAISRNGLRFAAAATGGAVLVGEVEGAQPEFIVAGEQVARQSEFSTDGEWLAVDRGARVEIFALRKPKDGLARGLRDVRQVQFSANGMRFLTLSGPEGLPEVALWEEGRSRPLRIPLQTDDLREIKLHPDGRSLAYRGRDGDCLTVYRHSDFDDWKGDRPARVSAPYGDVAAALADQSAEENGCNSGHVIASRMASGKWLAAVDEGAKIVFRSGGEASKLRDWERDQVAATAEISPDGRWIAIVSERESGKRCEIGIWAAQTGQRSRGWPSGCPSLVDPAMTPQFSSDGRAVAWWTGEGWQFARYAERWEEAERIVAVAPGPLAIGKAWTAAATSSAVAFYRPGSATPFLQLPYGGEVIGIDESGGRIYIGTSDKGGRMVRVR